MLQLKADPRSGIWQIHGTIVVWKGGKPESIEIRRSSKSRDRDQADAIRRQIENEVAERNHTGREPAITFEEAARRYERNGGEARYLMKPIAQLGRFRIDAIGQAEIQDAANRAYPDPKLSPSTIRRQFYVPVLAILAASGQTPRVQRPAEGSRRTYFFTPKQADALIAQIVGGRYKNHWTSGLATFLFGQGVRVSEALGIDGRDDINLDGGYAILRDTKNGEQRTVMLIPRVIAALAHIPNLGAKGQLFLRYDGRPYEDHKAHDRGNPMRFWRSACTAVGLEPSFFTPHVARHSWATWFYSQTRDVVRLKDQGGWKSDEWQRYVKLAHPSLGRDAKRLGWDFTERAGPDSDFAEIMRATG